eukprot:392002_1
MREVKVTDRNTRRHVKREEVLKEHQATEAVATISVGCLAQSHPWKKPEGLFNNEAAPVLTDDDELWAQFNKMCPTADGTIDKENFKRVFREYEHFGWIDEPGME